MILPNIREIKEARFRKLTWEENHAGEFAHNLREKLLSVAAFNINKHIADGMTTVGCLNLVDSETQFSRSECVTKLYNTNKNIEDVWKEAQKELEAAGYLTRLDIETSEQFGAPCYILKIKW